MKNKTRVAILFGGKSAEHEVSLQSAKNVISAIDKEAYEVVPVEIDKNGKWVDFTFDQLATIDVVFPVLHGTYGEDGAMQGLLKSMNVPFVGADVLGSAVGMDKDVMKRLLRDAGIPIGKFITIQKEQKFLFSDAVDQLGLPLFVKPANLGSSVGVSKVHDKEEFEKAVEDAFQYDNKILIEEFIEGREIECAVLGNEKPKASVPGEVIPHREFYSYEAKYIDEDGAGLKIPAELPTNIKNKVQDLAIRTFQVLCCEGMGRVDCFVTKDNEVYINEINTIPGFTKISMYPKLWEASGLSYSDLITKLIELAIERFERTKKLKSSFAV